MIGLHVRVEHRDDRDALRLRQGDVVVDEINVRVDDGELATCRAAEQVGGACGFVVEQLSEEHVDLQAISLDLTSYQLIY